MGGDMKIDLYQFIIQVFQELNLTASYDMIS